MKRDYLKKMQNVLKSCQELRELVEERFYKEDGSLTERGRGGYFCYYPNYRGILESEGWHTIIVSNKTHMWLLVEIKDRGYIPVEATGLFVVWWDNPNFNSYFIYDNSWEGET